MTAKKFQKWTFFLLLYTLLVILWGAWVRISHSGDGCGDTWPLCHGQLIPAAERSKTWVEYAHRVMSGLYGLVVIYFYILARQVFPRQHLARTAAFWTLVFMITEALLGAKLVLFQLVGSNDTPFRAFAMGLHQVNSLLLTGALTITHIACAHTSPANRVPTGKSKTPWWPIALFLLIAITGAFAALSSTLFPSQNLFDEILRDFSAESHYLIRLRGLHPLMAVVGGGALAIFLNLKAQEARTDLLKKTSFHGSMALILGIAFGVATLLSLSPAWMKITHLALAQCMWFFLLRFIFAWKMEQKTRL